MTRTKLPARRLSVTQKVGIVLDSKDITLLITIGLDTSYIPRDVFCANFKAGTSMHAIVTDACILLSLLLQHNEDPLTIAARMTPGSLIEALCNAVAAAVPSH